MVLRSRKKVSQLQRTDSQLERRKKAPKGTVSVQVFKERLRLCWSYRGKRYFLYLGLPDGKMNRIVAEGKARQIEGDIATGNFDCTLRDFKLRVLNALRHQRFGHRQHWQLFSRMASAQRLAASEVWTRMPSSQSSYAQESAQRLAASEVWTHSEAVAVNLYQRLCSTPCGIRGLDTTERQFFCTRHDVLNALRHQRFGHAPTNPGLKYSITVLNALRHQRFGHSSPSVVYDYASLCSTPCGIRGLDT
jgi:hypothetical protein